MLLLLCFSVSLLVPCLTQLVRKGAAGSPADWDQLSPLSCVMFYWTCVMDGAVPLPLQQPESQQIQFSDLEQVAAFKDRAGS